MRKFSVPTRGRPSGLCFWGDMAVEKEAALSGDDHLANGCLNDGTLELTELNRAKSASLYYWAPLALLGELSLIAFSTCVRNSVHVHA